VDTDQDGVPDSADKCPKEPAATSDGCPIVDTDADGVPDAKDACPTEAGKAPCGCPIRDADGDKVIDELDKCPNVAGPIEGCPDPDPDRDGINDDADKCPTEPETKNGYQDDDGCPDEIPQKVKQFTGVIQGINFKTSDAALQPSSFPTLDKAVAVLKEFGDLKLEIQGHTDDQPVKAGARFADNQALSQARADSVKAYMVSKGIDEVRLSVKG